MGGRKAPSRYELQKVKNKHRRIAEDVVLGGKDKDIAAKHGVTPQMVAYTRESALVQQYLGFMEGAIQADTLELAREIRELAPYALRVMETIMLNPSTDNKLRAGLAQDILDRAGHGAVKQMAVAHGHLSAADIDDIKKRARNAGVVSSGSEAAEEATYTEIDDADKGE